MQTHANAYKHLQTCRRIHAAEMRTHVTCLQIRLIYTTESERDWEKKNQRRWHPQQQGALTTPSFHKCFRFSWSWDWAAISTMRAGITIYTLESMYCILHIMLWDSSLQNHCILYIIAVPFESSLIVWSRFGWVCWSVTWNGAILKVASNAWLCPFIIIGHVRRKKKELLFKYFRLKMPRH